eukprot:gnl/TRDRNA2_/TRDRNA2_159833_c0_seq1.p1 gnl/TRDRNA2_/TRDRNA2_159833_c0~~gnl/TRDRNA2_/TRDRNA2_159833_c0_seq1.p1  ORF type:complete len:194 (+),score=18.43 gnl/TRDRNA2_/TRDRNA2_159833_c0_seq1:452-1033(+)
MRCQRCRQSRSCRENSTGNAIARASLIYCDVLVLEAVQQSRLFNDSKSFVDMPMKMDPEDVLAAFKRDVVPEPHNVSVLPKFADAHFEAAGTKLEEWTLPDWQQEPEKLFGQLKSEKLRMWASGLDKLCRLLGWKIRPDGVAHHPPMHSLLLPKSGFVRDPGGRFRETHYWDTYWSVLGLFSVRDVRHREGCD